MLVKLLSLVDEGGKLVSLPAPHRSLLTQTLLGGGDTHSHTHTSLKPGPEIGLDSGRLLSGSGPGRAGL